MNQGNHDTISQLALIMQMYPDDKRRRQELAARVAAEIPAISPQIGADALAVVYEWLEANGAATSPTGGVFKQTASKFHRILSKMLIYKEYRSFPTSHL